MTVLLVVLSPVFLVLVLAIRLSSRGPAIFRQRRAGRHGVPFTLYKFRTMRVNVDPFGPSPKSGIDPRLTGVGRWLRETSLDELPQLVNIVRGDMSFVGPRPLYVAQIQEWDERQQRRLLVKPGLTGLAQISGRGTLTREEKLDLDVQYVDRTSPGLDLRILLATVAQVFSRRGIYERRYSGSMATRGDKT
ncbi:MAG: sugar transferase [Sedimentisphaerales bacterium]|nr:sugar transferase [Sedimentisphaerales bacterium]